MEKITSYDQLPPFKELFEPDFKNGKLYWKINRGKYLIAGKEAGSYSHTNKFSYTQKDYCRVKIGTALPQKTFKRGKILYFLKYGVYPQMIDHINGDSRDDRIYNLREITREKNNWSSRWRTPNRSLPYGVKPNSKNTFQANASAFKNPVYLGTFSTIQDAKRAYDKFYHSYYGQDLSIDYYLNIQQSSPEWHFLRQNRITGTSAYNLLQTNSIQETLQSLKKQKPFKGNYWTERGKTLEPDARDIYTQLYNADMHEVGAVINSKFPQALWSPDGLVGLEGAIEIKCLAEKNHFEVHKNISPQYLAQIQFGLFISERKWCDLINYNPDLENPHDAFLIKRIYPIPEIQEKFYNIFRKDNYECRE